MVDCVDLREHPCSSFCVIEDCDIENSFVRGASQLGLGLVRIRSRPCESVIESETRPAKALDKTRKRCDGIEKVAGSGERQYLILQDMVIVPVAGGKRRLVVKYQGKFQWGSIIGFGVKTSKNDSDDGQASFHDQPAERPK
jgi:hypothetical protein